MTRLLGHFFLSLIATCFLSPRSEADIIYDTVGNAYSQSFDGLSQTGTATIVGRGPHAIQGVLSSTGMAGWYMANPSGSSSSTEFRAQNGSLSGSAGRGVISFGTTGSNDRALGALPTSNQVNSFGALFTNSTGVTLSSVSISFTGEQWRAGDLDIANVLSFQYGFGSSIDDATIGFAALNFNVVNSSGGNIALDGNLPANQSFVQATISGLDWQTGQTMAIRWNAVDISGQDNGLAIDNFSFSAVPEPTSIALLGCVMLGAAGLRFRRSFVK